MKQHLSGRLSPNFTWREMLHSDTARREGISNQPSLFAASNLTRLAYQGLEPVRSHFGKSITPSSGYRSPALNLAIGGSLTSNHSVGCACDFEIIGVDNFEVAKWITKNIDIFDEVILEAYTGGNTGWIHLAIRPENNRRKILTWDRKTYKKGLIK